MKLKIYTLCFFAFLIANNTWAQTNDECETSIYLENVAEYCSSPAQYTNANASLSAQTNATCFPQEEYKDVWFSFKAIGTDAKIKVVGAAGNNSGGTLISPEFALYSGECSNLTEQQCFSDAFNANVAESLINGLVPGQIYYIRVAARNSNVGTFQLCVTNFNAVPEPSSDCPTGVILCDKQSFSVESLQGVGSLNNELTSDDCIGTEFSSAWYKWTCGTAGTLTFTLTPTNPNDDLDFSVYELPNGLDYCDGKVLLRCMASGENVGQPYAAWAACSGATGLSEADNDTNENPGCSGNDNNFAAALNMEAGKSYTLIVNNFSNSGFGFDIEFGGTGTFLGPEPKFTLDPEEGTQCDIDQVTFTNNSDIPTGMGANYEWFFGNDATPATANTVGPHEVTYSGFGTKTILLRITTDEGCVVTDIREIFIEPCCPLDSDFSVEALDTTDPLCADEATGSFSVEATGGFPTYQYSLDGEIFQLSNTFNFQEDGNYQVLAVDKKGCRDSVDIVLIDPTPLIVYAGEYQTVELGETTTLNGQLVSSNGNTYPPVWNPGADIVEDSLTYRPTVFPLTTTEYVLLTTDENGCTALDTTIVYVSPRRPLYAPNAFTPNDDGINDNFTIFGNRAAVQVRYLRVFNRWGSLVFENTNFPLNNPSLGWDGTSNGKKLNHGVYVYVAEVEFLDGATVILKGDVSLL